MFFISHKQYTDTEALVLLAKQKLKVLTAPWAIHFWTFLIEWFSPAEYIVVLTSGSIGIPKSIRHTKKSMIVSARSTIDFLHLKEGMRALLCMDTRYIGAKMMFVRAWVANMDLVVVEPTMNPLVHLSYTVDFAAMVPMQVEAILDKDIHLLDKVALLIIGGAPISSHLEHRIESVSTKCYATFGMTETISHIALRCLNGLEKQSRFYPLSHTNLSVGKDSCLIVHAFDLGIPLLHTHDIVKLYSNQSFLWLGRKDNVINSGGVKIHPEQLEKILSNYIDVPFFVIGQIDAQLGHCVVLYIEGETWDKEEIKRLKSQMKKNVPRYHIPKEIYFRKVFLYTPTGKIKRRNMLK